MLKAVFKRDLTKREQIIMFLTVIAILGALVYQFAYVRLTKSVSALTAEVVAAEREIHTLAVQISYIKSHESEIKTANKRGIAGWDLVDRKGVILFLEDVSSEARRQGVSLLSVHPTQEIDKDKYKELSMNLDLKGRYRELAEYFRHLENLSRVVNIRRIRVEACPDASSICATQLEAVTYMEK
jgi:Tfp pilus assembly protein PilO